jgi:hypothetical protein
MQKVLLSSSSVLGSRERTGSSLGPLLSFPQTPLELSRLPT